MSPTFDRVADILAGQKTGQKVRLRGWVHRQRTGGKLAFVVLRDGSGTVQCTVKAGVADDASLDAAKAAALESSVEELEGTAIADPRAPGGYEVQATRFVLHQRAEAFPLRGEQGTEFELDKRHLWLRSTELSAILRIKGRLYKAIRDFFVADGLVEVDPSVITTNACEGGSTLFTFEYFGQTAYLSQSAQMYLEGCIFGIPKVFCITPSFRAEKSRTTKHLTEFHHLEAEAAWWDAEENRRFQERMVTHLAHTIAKECEADLRLLGQDPARLMAVQAPFQRMDYAEALQILQDKGFHIPYGEDFGVPHEKALTEGRTSPIFICDWPAHIKAFYMAEKPGTDRVLCSDMMAPDGYGELIGGSQRSEDIEWMRTRLLAQWHAMRDSKDADDRRQFQHEADAIRARLQKARTPAGTPAGTPPPTVPDADVDAEYLKPYEWYFDLRRFGSVPHAGFGLGIERLMRWFTGQEHIRDMLPYPRTPARAYP